MKFQFIVKGGVKEQRLLFFCGLSVATASLLLMGQLHCPFPEVHFRFNFLMIIFVEYQRI